MIRCRLLVPVLLVAAVTLAVAPASAQTGSPDVTAPANPVTAGAPPAAPPMTLGLTGPDLAKGASGIEVALLQLKLAQRGFWLSDQLGSFGDSTRHAVIVFQKFFGLRRSGVVDGYTRLAIAGFGDRATVREPGGGHRIEIDLGRQVLIVSTNDVVDWVFDISSGKPSTPTPRGSFHITREIRGIRRSSLGVLFSPKYFTGGYAIHGSNSVPTGPASHGCIRVTNQTINFLWASGLAPIGTPVKVA